jgi:hypothetical protein
MTLIRTAIVAALCLAASVAKADWQYTRWGMTVDEAIAASNGELQRCTPEVCLADSTTLSRIFIDPKGAFGPYQWGSYKFTAFLNFYDGKLLAVNLLLHRTWDDVATLVSALDARYGTGEHMGNDDDVSQSWIWSMASDTVSLTIFNATDETVLRYGPTEH